MIDDRTEEQREEESERSLSLEKHIIKCLIGTALSLAAIGLLIQNSEEYHITSTSTEIIMKYNHPGMIGTIRLVDTNKDGIADYKETSYIAGFRNSALTKVRSSPSSLEQSNFNFAIVSMRK